MKLIIKSFLIIMLFSSIGAAQGYYSLTASTTTGKALMKLAGSIQVAISSVNVSTPGVYLNGDGIIIGNGVDKSTITSTAFSGNFVGPLNGNADTVTNGAYTNYANSFTEPQTISGSSLTVTGETLIKNDSLVYGLTITGDTKQSIKIADTAGAASTHVLSEINILQGAAAKYNLQFYGDTNATYPKEMIIGGAASNQNIRITKGNYTPEIYIKDTGNIGIGTVTPSHKLAVEGGIIASSSITATGGFYGALTGAVAGNADTATALAADPTDCTLPNVALGINASGTAQCSQPSNVTGNAATVTTNANLTGNVTSVGNATTIAVIPAVSGASLTSLTAANISDGTLGAGVLQTEWDTAYGWGDHSVVGYLTSYTETDPIYINDPAFGITATNISNWGSAYGWGNHASGGYADASTVATDTTTISALATSNETQLTQVAVDTTTLQDNIDLKVSKAGDTMTGNLTFNKTLGGIIFKNDSNVGTPELYLDSGSAYLRLAGNGLLGETDGGQNLGLTNWRYNNLYLGGLADVTGRVTATGGFIGDLTGNADTSTALASNPTDCAGGEFASSIDASGNLTCSAPTGGGDVVLASTQTFTGENTFEGDVVMSSATIDNATINTSTFSITTNGFTYLPNGLIYQWGYYTGGANNPTITFSKTFPDQTFSVICQNEGVAGTNGQMTTLTSYSTSNFSCEVNRHDSLGLTSNFFWTAIGY